MSSKGADERVDRAPIADFSKLKLRSISERASLVDLDRMASLERYAQSGSLLDLFPDSLKARDLRDLIAALSRARAKKARILWGIGAHPIKVGLAPILIKMIEEGYIGAIALNGATALHDLEIAYHGATSEDVAAEIESGRFGMARESSAHYNSALIRHRAIGAGAALGRYINEEKFKWRALSILAAADRLKVPATIHIALGTDVAHLCEEADGATLGEATFHDFKKLTPIVSEVETGEGIYLNLGSAVILPEIFLKALSAARNLRRARGSAGKFMTVNLDMIQSYRPTVNVVSRPTAGSSARGIALTGHHEIMIPLIYHLLQDFERAGGEKSRC